MKSDKRSLNTYVRLSNGTIQTRSVMNFFGDLFMNENHLNTTSVKATLMNTRYLQFSFGLPAKDEDALSVFAATNDLTEFELTNTEPLVFINAGFIVSAADANSIMSNTSYRISEDSVFSFTFLSPDSERLNINPISGHVEDMWAMHARLVAYTLNCFDQFTSLYQHDGRSDMRYEWSHNGSEWDTSLSLIAAGSQTMIDE